MNSNALARNFRKGYFQAFRRWPSRTYMAPIARQLNGRVGFFRALGKHATWYVPAVIGAYNFFDASPEMRMRTLFAEGFGVVGGAVGTVVGTKLAVLGSAGVASMFGLCIGPFGMFILVFLLASAAGLYFSDKFRKLGNGIYDIGSHFGNGDLYYSPNQIIESF